LPLCRTPYFADQAGETAVRMSCLKSWPRKPIPLPECRVPHAAPLLRQYFPHYTYFYHHTQLAHPTCETPQSYQSLLALNTGHWHCPQSSRTHGSKQHHSQDSKTFLSPCLHSRCLSSILVSIIQASLACSSYLRYTAVLHPVASLHRHSTSTLYPLTLSYHEVGIVEVDNVNTCRLTCSRCIRCLECA
jgi:hypothetical protein